MRGLDPLAYDLDPRGLPLRDSQGRATTREALAAERANQEAQRAQLGARPSAPSPQGSMAPVVLASNDIEGLPEPFRAAALAAARQGVPDPIGMVRSAYGPQIDAARDAEIKAMGSLIAGTASAAPQSDEDKEAQEFGALIANGGQPPKENENEE